MFVIPVNMNPWCYYSLGPIIPLHANNIWALNHNSDKSVFQWFWTQLENMLYESVSVSLRFGAEMYGIDALKFFVRQQSTDDLVTLKQLLKQTSFVYSKGFLHYDGCLELKVDKHRVSLFVHRYANKKRLLSFPYISLVPVTPTIFDPEICILFETLAEIIKDIEIHVGNQHTDSHAYFAQLRAAMKRYNNGNCLNHFQ